MDIRFGTKRQRCSQSEHFMPAEGNTALGSAQSMLHAKPTHIMRHDFTTPLTLMWPFYAHHKYPYPDANCLRVDKTAIKTEDAIDT